MADKSSSPSDKAYWQRRKLSPGTWKERKALRHCARMGKTKAQLAATGAFSTPTFPKIHTPRAIESVTFTGAVRGNWENLPVQMLIVDGKTVEVSLHSSDIDNAKREISPRLSYRHVSVSPVSGHQTLISHR